ncbi:RRP15-like protein [Bombina bombina]|uniref:RRP15-like protein n=1 Tax=Bombina bombina TaxID=8345 RepID=UPI00235B141E|nr:RRP15-like protein [Bombina bombina]
MMDIEIVSEQPDPEGSEAGSDVEDVGSSSDGDADSGNEGGDSGNDNDSEDGDPNKGWADAMAKILNKKISTGKSSTILVKSKALEKEKEKEKQEKLEKKKQLDKKRQWEMMCRVKPDVVKGKEVERNLQRIATRGVVQLFNAVRTHQGNISDKLKEVGGSERKRSKLISSVSKKDFIDVLRGKESKTEQSVAKKRGSKKPAVKSENVSEWSILRDDFMMGASMKDWDKDSVDGEHGVEPKRRHKLDDSASDSDT